MDARELSETLREASRLVAGESDGGPLRDRIERAIAWAQTSAATPAELFGSPLCEALVEAAGELEPDERLVRAAGDDRAIEELVATILFEGIVEFVRRLNTLGDQLPGVGLAKKLGGGLLGGLAGAVVGAVGADFEKRIAEQARAFVGGFVRVAVERGMTFALAPQNRPMFRELRKRLLRRVLETPLDRLARPLARSELERARARVIAEIARLAASARGDRAGAATAAGEGA